MCKRVQAKYMLCCVCFLGIRAPPKTESFSEPVPNSCYEETPGTSWHLSSLSLWFDGLVKSLASLLHSSSFTSDFTALRIRKSSVVRPSRCGVWSISLSHTHTLLRQLSSGSWLGIKLDQTISNLHMPPTAGSERRLVPKTSTTSTTFRSGTPLIAKWSPK